MIQIEGYAAIERIGQGGLGDVYRATRESTGGIVAVKVLRDVSDESVAWHRTRRELAALVALAGHANVIQLIELLELPDGPALVMEYAPGGSVAELLLRRDGPLTKAEAVLIGQQTAAALAAAHDQSIVHRDVKPQNLLIDAYGQIKLCDFGIAAIARTAEFQVRTSALSMRYASPEDLDDEVDIGPPSDIYSLGATLLHLVHGAPPTLKERLAPWRPTLTGDEQIDALDAVIASCLNPDPSARPTAAVVLDDLERLGWSFDDRSRSLAVDDAPPTPSTEPPSRRPAGTVAPDAPLSDAGSGSHGQPVDTSDGMQVRASPDDHIDDTYVRTGRRPPSRPPLPAPPRRSRGVVLALAGALVIVVALAAFWPEGDDSPIEQAGVVLVDRPAGLTPVTNLDWPSGELGECLAQRDDDSFDSVACDSPHDLERFMIGEISPDQLPGDGSFDAAAIRDVVGPRCDAAFESYTGVDNSDSELDAPFTVPRAESWATGDRRFECWLAADGRRLVGTPSG